MNWSMKAVLGDPVRHELLQENSLGLARAGLLMCKFKIAYRKPQEQDIQRVNLTRKSSRDLRKRKITENLVYFQ